MGSGKWDPSAYLNYSSTIRNMDAADIFKTTAHSYHAKTGSKDSLNPKGIKVRESRDSAVNPASTACIIALDVTGSMGMLAEVMAKEGLGICFDEILKRKPITDPHLMFMAVGDCSFDQAPLQVSQFEADDKIIPQLADIWVEHGGGGNHYESYNLPWYFAAMHTSIDCVEKRNKKGYLFTVGDENAPEPLLAQHITQFIGDTPERDFSNAELLSMVSRMYHVFHVMVAQGSHAQSYPDRVRKTWTELLGQRALWLTDHTKLSEVIVSAIQVTEGANKDDVTASWKGDTALVVRTALSGDLTVQDSSGSDSGVTRFK